MGARREGPLGGAVRLITQPSDGELPLRTSRSASGYRPDQTSPGRGVAANVPTFLLKSSGNSTVSGSSTAINRCGILREQPPVVALGDGGPDLRRDAHLRDGHRQPTVRDVVKHRNSMSQLGGEGNDLLRRRPGPVTSGARSARRGSPVWAAVAGQIAIGFEDRSPRSPCPPRPGRAGAGSPASDRPARAARRRAWGGCRRRRSRCRTRRCHPRPGSRAPHRPADIPSTLSLNCHMTSGFSGFPKFRLSTTAKGRAPVTAMLSAAS